MSFGANAANTAWDVAWGVLAVWGVIVAISFVIVGVVVFLIGSAYRRRALAREQELKDSDALPATVEQILARPIPSGTFARFLDGIKIPWDGFRMMSVYPPHVLWRYSIAPALMSMLVTTIVIAALIAGVSFAIEPLHSQFGNTWASRLMEFGAFALLILGALGVAFVSWLMLQAIFCGHFYMQLTRQVELILGATEDEFGDEPFLRQLVDSILDVTQLVFRMLGMLLLNMIPILGSILSVAGTLFFDCLFAGIEFLDYPMILHAIQRRDRRRVTFEHRAMAIGLGVSVLLLVLIPGVGIALLSTSVTGASLTYHRLRLQGYLTEINVSQQPQPV